MKKMSIMEIINAIFRKNVKTLENAKCVYEYERDTKKPAIENLATSKKVQKYVKEKMAPAISRNGIHLMTWEQIKKFTKSHNVFIPSATETYEKDTESVSCFYSKDFSELIRTAEKSGLTVSYARTRNRKSGLYEAIGVRFSA